MHCSGSAAPPSTLDLACQTDRPPRLHNVPLVRHLPPNESSAEPPDRGLESLGLTVNRLDEVDSTNAYARCLVEQGGAEGPRFIVARTQTGGYGRRGRKWHSPPGGLWCTLLAPAPTSPSDGGPVGFGDMGLRVGVACLEAITIALENAAAKAEVVRSIRLKWPNDVLIDDRKVCGSLCEVITPPQSEASSESGSSSRRSAEIALISWLVLGVGINANNDPASLPSDLRRPATSLAAILGQPVNLAWLEHELGRRLSAAASRALTWRSVVESAAARLAGLDEEIERRLPTGEVVRGILKGLSDLGTPVLMVNGRRFIVPAGAETV